MNPDSVEMGEDPDRRLETVFVVVPDAALSTRRYMDAAQEVAEQLATEHRRDYVILAVREHQPGKIGLRAEYKGVVLKVQETDSLSRDSVTED